MAVGVAVGVDVRVRVGRSVLVGVDVQSEHGVDVGAGVKVGATVGDEVGVQFTHAGKGVEVLTMTLPPDLLGASSTSTIGDPPTAQPYLGSSHLAPGSVNRY